MNEPFREIIAADQAWMNLSDLEKSIALSNNPLSSIYNDEPLELARNLLKVMTRTDYMHLMCRLVFNFNVLPVQNVILQEIWDRSYPMLIQTRGGGKTTLLALYCFLRALLKNKTKIVIAAAGFRQAKFMMEYMEGFWRNAPVFRDICNKDSGLKKDIDRYVFHINDSTITAIPTGDGSTIRGMRANIIINDEFGATRPDIYEIVISGFTAVTASPYENVIKMAKKNFLKKNNLWISEYDKMFKVEANQSIIAGTAGYDFEHFADYWKRYKKIIESCGDEKVIKEIYTDGIPEDFNWRDYSVIRIPYDLMPEGFMDAKSVARSKAVNTDGNYLTEYGACFIKDSTGFFRRTLIESCVTSDTKPIRGVWFDVSTQGNPKLKYVISCDPASEKDNFAITVIELHGDHNRLVYCWTTNRQSHLKLVESGVDKENNFYAYCARKIRSLMATFPCARIAIDREGGGRAVIEALHDKDKIQPGEQLLWPIIDPEKESPTDQKEGLHIIEEIYFSKADWVSEANQTLKKDMEDKALLFPRYDNLSIGLASEMDGIDSNKSDSLENLIYEIEELKDELCTIVHTKSNIAGRDRWDTPEIKGVDGKKGRSRKDRYSALLMANMVARQLSRADAPLSFGMIGKPIDKSNKRLIKQEKNISNNLYSVPWNTFKGIKRR